MLLIGGGLAALVAAGAAFLLLGGQPTPPVVPPPPNLLAQVTPPADPPPTLPALPPTSPQPPILTPQPLPTTAQPPVTPPPLATTTQPPVTPPPTQLALAQPALPNFNAAAAALATAPLCGLFNATALPNALALEGVLRRGDDAALRRLLAARDIPAAATRLALQGFDGPYCPALDALRPVLAGPGQAPRVALIGSMPLLSGQLLRLDVTMPEWPAHLYVAYFMASGEVANLVPSATHPPGSTVRLGEPRAGFPGWEVSEPFGTDLLVAVVSEGPLFGNSRPDLEPQASYVAALDAALGEARRAGRRVLIRPFVVETAPR